MMTEKKIKQHYVPRFYMKSIARQKKQDIFVILCFNKETGEKYEQNITQTAMERYFYDDSDPPEIENLFSRLEGFHADIYHKIISEKSVEGLTQYDKFMMCHYIMIQNERTRSARIRNAQMVELVYKYLEKEKYFPPFENFSEDYKKKLLESRAAMGQINIMFNPIKMEGGTVHHPFEVVFKMAELGWTLLKNDLRREFYTSDHPVFVYNPPIKGEKMIRGYGSKVYTTNGVEIYFPLTPRLCLVIYDKKNSYYKNSALKRRVIQKELDWINTQIIAMAHRTVFTKNNDFQFVRECLIKYPELKDSDRKRLYF